MEGGGLERSLRRNKKETAEQRHVIRDQIDDLALDLEEASDQKLDLHKVRKDDEEAFVAHARDILTNDTVWEKVPDSTRLTPEYLSSDRQLVEEEEKAPERIVNREEARAKLAQLIAEHEQLRH
ncbi:MAG TPA: hypothetical protein VM103_01585 [Candidatus Paceibacterota bacterium]|nr:hypothetical protein [Candidatus Paceibacterota bacterium]